MTYEGPTVMEMLQNQHEKLAELEETVDTFDRRIGTAENRIILLGQNHRKLEEKLNETSVLALSMNAGLRTVEKRLDKLEKDRAAFLEKQLGVTQNRLNKLEHTLNDLEGWKKNVAMGTNWSWNRENQERLRKLEDLFETLASKP